MLHNNKCATVESSVVWLALLNIRRYEYNMHYDSTPLSIDVMNQDGIPADNKFVLRCVFVFSALMQWDSQ